jgi:hypothetical protein
VLACLARRWQLRHAAVSPPPPSRRLVARLEDAAPAVAAALAAHPFIGLGGQTLAAAAGATAVRAARIAALCPLAATADGRALARLPPLVAIAALCRARLTGSLTPRAAERASLELLTYLATRRDAASGAPPPLPSPRRLDAAHEVP